MQKRLFVSASAWVTLVASLVSVAISEEMKGPAIIAHRGASEVAPENTKSAITTAIRMGATVIEFDVRNTSDGELVLFHDDEMERLLGKKGRIEEVAWDEVKSFDVGAWFGKGQFAGEKPIRLADAITICVEGGAVALIEHKTGDAKSYAEVIQSLHAEKDVIVQSFNWKFLEEFQKLLPAVPTGALGSKKLSADRIEKLKLLQSNWVGWHFKDLTVANLEDLQGLGFQIALWTVNDPAEAKRWLDRGVDGIITDRPDAMLPLLPLAAE